MRFSWIPILSFLPKNLISHVFGFLSRLRIPLFSSFFRNIFVKLYKIDMSEAELELNQYKSLSDLFVRKLKPGMRPIAAEEIVSPVDGVLSQFGHFKDLELSMIQAKGKKYNLGSLLRDDSLAQKFAGGTYAVIYLAPHNYHRIHSPIQGELLASYYCPGNLWPVNADSVSRIEGLFCINERATSHLKSPTGEMLLVKVGATNVGRIALEYPSDWITNSSSAPSRHHPLSVWKPEQPISVEAGSLLGKFELGSTVVIVLDKNFTEKHPQIFANKLNQKVKMGESLCS